MTLSSTVPINRMSMVADLRRGTGQVSVVGILAGLASLAGQRRLGELPTNGHEIHPGMQLCKPVAISNLDGTGAWLYHLPMIIAATMTIARRRRIFAVWADVCV
jgi:hypothetical protein